MKRWTWKTAALAALGLLGTVDVRGAAAAESPWGALLRNDVEAMHRRLREDHPGTVDQENAGFRKWLAAGRAQALERARTARSFEAYAFALRAYAVGFQDGHLEVSTRLSRDGASWAGFLVGHQQGKLIVRARSEARGQSDASELPPLGSELVSCDGVAAAELLRRDVFPFHGNPDLEGQWDKVAPWLFVDESNPWRKALPKSCDFRDDGKGAPRPRPITWRWLRWGELWDRVETAAQRANLDFVIRPFGARGIWVGLPTFNAKNGEILPRLKAAVAAAPGWRDRDPIVFDVRTNGGGSSSWGHQILKGLYGEAYVAGRLAPLMARMFVDWRASPGNVGHAERLIEQLVREGRDPASIAASRRWVEEMRAAQKQGKPYWRHGFEEQAKAPPPPPGVPVKGRVFLLTDGACGSACLDFADMVLAMPGTTHVGRATYADSVYMESRYVDLPSGSAELGFAVKVYRGRPRGNNQPYLPKPAFRFSGDIRDTAALERWILALPVEQASR